MNNREHWSKEELAMQNALDKIREEYPNFWNDIDVIDLSDLPEDIAEPATMADAPEVRETITLKPDSGEGRRRKLRRRVIVVCFVAVCLLSTAMTIFVNSDYAHAMKFAMEKKYYQAKGWVQATKPENVDDDNKMIIIEVDETKIVRYEEFWELLMYPGYMTEGYTFEKLHIEKYFNEMGFMKYTYVKENEVIVITISPDKQYCNNLLWITTEDVGNGLYKYKTWYDCDTQTRGINVIADNVTVEVSGKIDAVELIKIINGLNKK